MQQQVAAKRNEIEEQKRNLLKQQSQVRELNMDEIVDQGQVDSFCEVTLGDNLIEKMQVSITVKDGVIQSIDCLLYTSPSPRDLSTSRMPSSA